MRLITWNLNARRGSIPAQVAALARRSPDILALQEVSRGMVEPLRLAVGHTNRLVLLFTVLGDERPAGELF